MTRWLAPDSAVPTWIGLGAAAFGLALIAYTWGRVAGTLSVALQLPYIVSGGLIGIALVVVGAAIISLSARRRDAWLRSRQLGELSLLLRSVARLVDNSNDADVASSERSELVNQ